MRVDVSNDVVVIGEADLSDDAQARCVVELVDAYASEPIGGGRPLSASARERLIPGLRGHPTSLVFLAFAGGRGVGVAVCFLGYSTFAAKPLLNVHDLAVLRDWRGRGVGRRLLEAVEARARRLDCCRITLEVRDDNAPARALYRSFGFGAADGQHERPLVHSLEKPLADEAPGALARATRQPGLRKRLELEGRRISAQHRRLEALYEAVQEALEQGPERARAGFASFRSALDAHFEIEERTEFPALRGLAPACAGEIEQLVEEHRAFRAALESIAAEVDAQSLAQAQQELTALRTRLDAHESCEERLFAQSTARSPVAG